MTIYALSRSPSFERHLLAALGGTERPRILRAAGDLPGGEDGAIDVVVVHAPSFRGELPALLSLLEGRADLRLGVAADVPRLEEMLQVTEHGAHAYFNSYMADTHYLHMLRQLAAGQTWYAPDLLARVLAIARRRVGPASADETLGQLTPRQRDIGLDVAEGLSNREIARARGISERTVKAHLTTIFRRLGVKSRAGLAARLRTATRATDGDA